MIPNKLFKVAEFAWKLRYSVPNKWFVRLYPPYTFRFSCIEKNGRSKDSQRQLLGGSFHTGQLSHQAWWKFVRQ